MDELLTGRLINESVVNYDGTDIGSLEDITMNRKTGELLDLVVNTHQESLPQSVTFERDDRGSIRIPVSDVETINDHIIIRGSEKRADRA